MSFIWYQLRLDDTGSCNIIHVKEVKVVMINWLINMATSTCVMDTFQFNCFNFIHLPVLYRQILIQWVWLWFEPCTLQVWNVLLLLYPYSTNKEISSPYSDIFPHQTKMTSPFTQKLYIFKPQYWIQCMKWF